VWQAHPDEPDDRQVLEAPMKGCAIIGLELAVILVLFVIAGAITHG